MAKTASQIESDVFALLKNSDIADEITGKVYRDGIRPKDSKLEDAIVIFTAGLSGQIDSGIITVLIYVPNVNPFNNGQLVKNGKRLQELELLAKDWVKSLNLNVTDYKFELNQTIMNGEEPELNQHYVSIRLKYEFFDLEG